MPDIGFVQTFDFGDLQLPEVDLTALGLDTFDFSAFGLTPDGDPLPVDPVTPATGASSVDTGSDTSPDGGDPGAGAASFDGVLTGGDFVQHLPALGDGWLA